jgi:hypothetical protein
MRTAKMEPYTRNFIRTSLIWFGIGVTLGLWMALSPGAVIYRPAHMHANLLGFVSMMIYGVAYHVMPRFTGTPLWSPRLAWYHLFAANAGLGLMFIGWLLRPSIPSAGGMVLGAGALVSYAGAFMFIINIWRTISRTTSQVPQAGMPLARLGTITRREGQIP